MNSEDFNNKSTHSTFKGTDELNFDPVLMSPSVQKSVRDNIQNKMPEFMLHNSAKANPVFLVNGAFDGSGFVESRPAGGGIELITQPRGIKWQHEDQSICGATTKAGGL